MELWKLWNVSWKIYFKGTYWGRLGGSVGRVTDPQFWLRSWSWGREIKPWVRFCAKWGVCWRFSPSATPPAHAFSLSQSLKTHIHWTPISMTTIKKKKWRERTSVGEHLEKLEPLYSVCGMNVKWYNHYGKVWRLLKMWSMELPYDPAIPFLGISTKELKAESWGYSYTPTFIATLFSISTRWKRPKCPLRDKWIIKMLKLVRDLAEPYLNCWWETCY